MGTKGESLQSATDRRMRGDWRPQIAAMKTVVITLLNHVLEV